MINLTQHKASAEQVSAGVIDLHETAHAEICGWITFGHLPSREELIERARKAAAAAATYAPEGTDSAMIGGAPFFMGHLAHALAERGITPYYAFSRRVAVEKDGVKTSQFTHEGFVPHY